MNANDPIYLELVDFVAGGTTPQDVVNFRPSAEAQQRLDAAGGRLRIVLNET